MDWINILFFLLVIAPLCVLIHECGHALGGLIVKADQVRLEFGIGWKIKEFAWKKVQVVLYTFLFIGGLAQSTRNIPFTRMEVAIISVSGPLLNTIIAFLVICLETTSVLGQLFMFFNLWLAFINVIPFKWKQKKSDGYIIMQQLLKK
ncbi:hypothetical protein NC661_00600 [Aquibacillus koreensis]|uniref:Peptidase M50 domain-containing protein n=1 Tax=Aquibacillus koreensis TaxID=279446 RepID=A0A9X4AI33_9BACI|nr:site-2 protease family protein [Aquibacillus koreensis]MCT2537437.1 hypothetical protein [Aquibacillus koreensis]MDC3418883.1 hypothetical protein [Aquibacillus koreensis]